MVSLLAILAILHGHYNVTYMLKQLQNKIFNCKEIAEGLEFT